MCVWGLPRHAETTSRLAVPSWPSMQTHQVYSHLELINLFSTEDEKAFPTTSGIVCRKQCSFAHPIHFQLLTCSIRDSETSIDFVVVQGPPGSLRERVKI